MGISIVVEGQRPLSSERRRLVEESLQQGDGVSSRSGQTLAYAVAWCEEHKQPYTIAAMPGAGYHLKPALEVERRLALEPSVAGVGLDARLVRRLKAALHPDRVTSPEAKAQLERSFVLFLEALEGHVRTARPAASSARAKAAWAKRQP